MLEAVVERGMADGASITFERASEQTPGMVPGDVVLRIETVRHRVFKRDGSDLSMQLHLTLQQALLGFSRTIRHLDGHPVTIENKGVSQPHQVLTLPGEGMPVHGVPSEFGVLRVELIVGLPPRITDEERQFVEGHFEVQANAVDLTNMPSVFAR